MSILMFLYITQIYPSSTVGVPIWYYNVFFYLFVISIIVFGVIFYTLTKKIISKNAETKLIQQQYAAKIDVIRKEHSETLEKIRVDMLKREDDRARQWIESEKETLHVLTGVSNLLDLNENISKFESEKILKKLNEIQKKIEKLTESK